MSFLAGIVGLVFVLATLIDAFEVVLLPRPMRRRVRVHRYYYRLTWTAWSTGVRRLRAGPYREDFAGVFGPLSMVMLFALWAACLVLGFGLIQWALQPVGGQSLIAELILSGDAFFTLGYGDAVPHSTLAHVLIIFEAGTGFGFIALAVGYLPVLHQHFTRRDVQQLELSARAGTPASAVELLRWHASRGGKEQLDSWMRDWERWACDLIESHSAYPMLAFYRSQLDGHSWLASLAVVLDVCTKVMVKEDGGMLLQAEATFIAAKRILEEIGGSLEVVQRASGEPARPECEADEDASRGSGDAMATRLRATYEPQLSALASYLVLSIPPWVHGPEDETPAPTREEIVDRLIAARPRGRS